VWLIVYYHIAHIVGVLPYGLPTENYTFAGLGLGEIGVLILIFVSGAMIQYTAKPLLKPADVFSFYKHRLLRIYPVFWAALILSVILYRTTYTQWEWTGFAGFKGMEIVNGSAWFITVIIILYLLFPLLTASIKKYPMLSIGILYALQYFFNVSMRYNANLLWFVFVFSLGVFVVQNNWYPKFAYNNYFLKDCSDLTFYVFLIHYPILINIVGAVSFYSYTIFGTLPSNIYYAMIIAMMAMINASVIFMYADRWLQTKINTT
jgi:peptidoglycan/LPS O-acetylase OafA/YrhL